MSELSNGWRRITLGDVAINTSAVSADPKAEGFERYVLGKHIPKDGDRVETWGPIGDSDFGPRIRTIFQPGDVICTTRGPKLKVARVEFKGLGAHTNFYLRTANPEVLTQPYLEAVVRSDGFQQHLVNNFRGSVNLFVNWSDAAKYEFVMPPPHEQAQAAVALAASARYVDAIRVAVKQASLLRRSYLVSVFRSDRGVRDQFPSSWTVASASDLGDIQLGQQRHPKYAEGDNLRPYLRVANVLDGRISFDDVNTMHFPKKDLGKFQLMSGDILLNEGQSTELVGRSAIYRGEIEGCCFQKSLLRFRCGEGLIPEFAQAFFQHCLYTGQFARLVVQTTSMAHLTAVRFKRFPIPSAPIGVQRDVATTFGSILNGEERLSERLASASRVARDLNRHVMSQAPQ